MLPKIEPPGTMSPIETPCLKVCVLEPGSGQCRGCGRTIDEIAGWGSMSGSERRRVMALLPDRIAALKARTELRQATVGGPALKD